MQSQFADLVALFAKPEHVTSLRGIHRGVEREALRITEQGTLAATPHPPQLGSAFKHPLITTDYAETLMEFITPVADRIEVTLQQLADVHKRTYQVIGDELLWPLSMPCFVSSSDDIVIAQYGSSHSGRMKTLYRQGLTYRYGSGMQIISGVHFNFSLPSAVFEQLAHYYGVDNDQDFVSSQYFQLIRNYKRLCWIIPYLFGASPAICKSFLQQTEGQISFEKHGKGTLYRPYGTSLRMSDLGYTNKEQADLKITYNSLADYVKGLRRAVTTESVAFSKIGVKVEGEYRQLNSNILQIENEFYATIRPKRVARAGETPTQALERGGVEYIEIRALDVNPFSPVGISDEQMRFLDLFLLYCIFKPSAELDWDAQSVTDANFNRVVLDGRNPRLTLNDNGYERPIADWLEELFADLQPLAHLMDQAHQTRAYTQAVANQYHCVLNPERTLSGQFMAQLQEHQLENGELGMALARQYKQQLATAPFEHFSLAQFNQWQQQSVAEQEQQEQQDATSSFDDFLEEYFRKALCQTADC